MIMLGKDVPQSYIGFVIVDIFGKTVSGRVLGSEIPVAGSVVHHLFRRQRKAPDQGSSGKQFLNQHAVVSIGPYISSISLRPDKFPEQVSLIRGRKKNPPIKISPASVIP